MPLERSASNSHCREPQDEKESAKQNLSQILSTKGTLHWVDLRKLVAGDLIRYVRPQGLLQLTQSIRRNGYSPSSILTVVPVQSSAEKETAKTSWEKLSSQDNSSEESEKAMLDKLAAEQRETVSKEMFMVVDGGHRCTAALQMYKERILPHPYVPAWVLSQTINEADRQAIAATINEVTGNCIPFHQNLISYPTFSIVCLLIVCLIYCSFGLIG
jgi:hypothetical protein